MAIQDAGYKPVEYAGTSGGSLISALAASGMSLIKMRDLALNHNWSNILKFNPTALMRGGFCDGNNLQSLIGNYTKHQTFRQLRTDLTIVASDVASESSFVFNKYNTPDISIAKAARCSASIPFVYAPVRIAKALLMDGGMIDNIPADLLVRDEIPRLGIQLTSKASPFGAANASLLNVAPRLLDLMLSATENAHRALALESGVHFAYVETGFAGSLDKNMSPDMRARLLTVGYNETRSALTELV